MPSSCQGGREAGRPRLGPSSSQTLPRKSVRHTAAFRAGRPPQYVGTCQGDTLNPVSATRAPCPGESGSRSLGGPSAVLVRAAVTGACDSSVVEARHLGSGRWQIWCPARTESWVTVTSVCPHVGGGWVALWGLFRKSTDPSQTAPPARPNRLQTHLLTLHLGG